ncbi:hypothetical protein WA577_005960, partial [Blastocystis sp. JDR]
ASIQSSISRAPAWIRAVGLRGCVCRLSTSSYPKLIKDNEWNNITPTIAKKVGMNIYQQPLNPICILKKTILKYFAKEYGNEFKVFEGISPVVTTTQAFDNLLIPKDHVTRRKSDTYFVDATHVLRPHTSAHQVDCLSKGADSFIVVGDCYRR